MRIRKVGTTILLILVVLLVASCSSQEKKAPAVKEVKGAAISGAATTETTKPVVKEPAKVEPVKTEPVVEPVKPETVKTETKAEVKPQGNIIKVTDTGFVPKELKVKVGDTVEWQNVRVGKIPKALIIGAQTCFDVKSAILESGESFKYTFEKADTCTIVEAITTTQVGKVVVE